jgi:DNA-binding response OmpR family regulator
VFKGIVLEKYGKLLLVEDDISLAQWVKDYLERHGYDVICIERGDTVIETFNQHQPDLVLLDVMLPGLSGIEVCRNLRALTKKPIIMLTARSDEIDEVIGLEVGANDYVVKPVRPRALLARIKTVLRFESAEESHVSNQTALSFGQLYLDRQAKRVTYHDKNILFTSGEFDFLWFLAKHAGRTVERDEVFQALKKREYDGQDRRFDLMVSVLRKKLNDSSQQPQKIKTVWGKGYLFVADAWDD